MSVGFIRFDDILNEKLKDPEFKKGFERAGLKLELELKFNEMLREMGYDDLCVEVLDMDEY
jgi:hypothetical protein